MPTPARSVNGSMSTIHVDGFVHADSSLKRKRVVEDQGDQETKKVQIEAPEKAKEVTIEDISQNVGSLFLFCKTRKASCFSTSSSLPGVVYQAPTQPCTSWLGVLG